MQKTITQEKKITLEGQEVTPLDDPRTYSRDHQVIGAAQTSGTMYTITSGKQGYIKQFIVTELSGSDGRVWLIDSSGYICPPINVKANSTVTWDVRPAACPTWGNILWQTEAASRLYGRATLIVQIDPQRIE